MPDKKRILIFPFNLLSHYLRCLVFAERFYDSDAYDIHFAASDVYDHYVQRAGYKSFPCEQFDAERVMEDSRRFDFAWLNDADINRVFNSQLECIRDLQPEQVIGDMAPTLRMAAELTGVRYISLQNGYMTPYCVGCRSLPTKHPAYGYFHRLPKNLLDRLTAYGETLAFKRIHKPFGRIRQRNKLKQFDSYLDEMQGDENLICDLPELFPQKNLPANFRFIAPLIYRESTSENTWLGEVDRSRPVIVVSMGSTGQWERLQFLNSDIYSAFTIITAGDKSAVLDASHIIARPFVDMAEVLAISDLMICHGGNGTIYHGLQASVFMLCLTSHFEQEWNVKALERLGYGKSADMFDADDWQEEITRMARQSFKPYSPQHSMNQLLSH